jgi:flavin-dependent thymidylate synthase
VYNSVELLGHYGGDETHALSAWTSTSRELTDDKRNRMDKLLNMLASAGHHTPFEKSSLHFLVSTDIASHIHIIKHRVGVSVNAESARYKELKEDKHYLPQDWPYQWRDKLEEHTNEGEKLYHNCIQSLVDDYDIPKKRAKESARFFKTYSSQITADVMFNFRSFAHFQNLRNKSDAQLEIHEIADIMLEKVKSIEGNPFKLTLEAFKL